VKKVKTHRLGEAAGEKVWQKLFNRQYKLLRGRAHPLFWKGLEALAVKNKEIPELKNLDEQLQKLSGFRMQRTPIQYAGDKEWFNFLSKRRIMVTNYIRVMEDLNYTPLPDIFHDIFGHMPLLSHKAIARLAEKFGRTFLAAETDLQRFMTERLWWNSMEFGLMLHNGRKVIIGAGLFSSFGECKHAFSAAAEHMFFHPSLLPGLNRSPHEFHKRFMVFRSFGQISKALDWISSHPKG